MRVLHFLMLAPAVMFGAPVTAQGAASSLGPGDRVRFSSRSLGYESKTATLTALVADSLVVVANAGVRGADNRWVTDTIRLAYRQLDKLELRVTRPRKSRGGHGAILGTLVGAAIAVKGARTREECQRDFSFFCGKELAAFGGGLTGFALGGVLGHVVFTRDRVEWVPVAQPQP